MTSDRRVAVVTGGASGIGEGCVRKMASEGYHVVVADRDIENARALVEELTTVGQWASMEPIDVADSTSVDECASIVQVNHGRLDVLVTAAGILESSANLLDMDLEAHDRVWRINYHGTIHCVRSFGKLMRAALHGAIVTVGSTTSFVAFPLPAYCPGKTAIRRLTEILAVELGRFGVRVNGVAPTYVITPAMQAKIDAGERDPEVLRNSGALNMLVEPRHIADAVAFLCSDAASAITGVMLPVDAGFNAAIPYRTYAGGVPWKE